MVLADDPGLGKTGQTLMALRWLKEARIVTRTLLVCPSKLMYQWANEAEKWFGDQLRCEVVDGTPKQRLRTYEALNRQDGHPLYHVDLVITNYSLLRRDLEHLKTVRFDQLVADEASALKNHSTDQTKAAKALSDHIARRLAISATPMQNHLDEYHSVLSVVDPDRLGSRESFISKYCNTAQFPVQLRTKSGRPYTHYVTTITGYRSIDVFKQTIAPVILQRTIEEVGLQMPTLTIIDRWVDMLPAQEVRYAEIENGILQLDANRQELLTEAIQRFVRLQQVVNLPGLLYRGEMASAKLDELREMLTSELSGRQVVIFSKSLEFLRQGVLPLLDDLKLTYAQIHGGIDNVTAERQRVEFQAGDRQIAVITTAGEMGLNLDAAPYMVCGDLLFNEARMRQVYARIRRVSSTHPNAVVYRLLTRNSFEERTLDLLAQRGALLDFLDSPSTYDQGSLQDLLRLVNRKISLLD